MPEREGGAEDGGRRRKEAGRRRRRRGRQTKRQAKKKRHSMSRMQAEVAQTLCTVSACVTTGVTPPARFLLSFSRTYLPTGLIVGINIGRRAKSTPPQRTFDAARSLLLRSQPSASSRRRGIMARMQIDALSSHDATAHVLEILGIWH